MQTRLWTIGLALALGGCSSITAHVDYDRQVDFDQYTTFAWAPTSETSLEDTAPLVHQRIVAAIQNKMQEGGQAKLVQPNENPDLFITYHTKSREELQVNTSSMGYGYGPGWGWDPYWGGAMGGMGGMDSSTTTVSTYVKGTLIIDAWDAKTKNLVWRGTVESTVSEDPQKGEKKIIKSIDKLADRWDKTYKARSQPE